MLFYDPTNREKKELRPGVNTRTFWGEHMLMGVVDLDANAVIPAHSHPQEQITYIVAGEMEMEIEGQVGRMQAGMLAVIPGGASHSVRVGPKPCKVVDVFSPAREDMKY
jgi:quercetin dioxygenase-like cupin family protein